MPLRVRKPLSGVILRSKIGVETITIHPEIDIPDQGMSRKTFPNMLLCAKHLLKHRHSPLRVNSYGFSEKRTLIRGLHRCAAALICQRWKHLRNALIADRRTGKARLSEVLARANSLVTRHIWGAVARLLPLWWLNLLLS